MSASLAAEVQPSPTIPVIQPAQMSVIQTVNLPKVKSTWRYPFLKLLQILLRIGGGVVMGAGMGLAVITVFTGTMIASSMLDQHALGTTGVTAVGNIITFFVILIAGLLLAAPLFAMAEFIQMFMDIEINQRAQLAFLQSGGLR